MRILMIAPEPVYDPRGTPISVHQRLIGMSKLGHQIDLATYHLGENISLEGLRIFRSPGLPFIKTIKAGPSWRKIPLDILLFLKSIQLLVTKDYDVIHTHEEAGFFTILLARIFQKYHLYDMHSSLPKQLVNYEFGDYRLMIAIFEYLEKLLINTCDAVITIGPDLLEHVRNINPRIPIEMIENLPLVNDDISGEDVRLFKNELGLDKHRLVVYTGTFEKYQGLEMLVESAGVVFEQYPESRFILVGGKPDQVKELKTQAEKKHLDRGIIFTGSLSSSEANRYLEMADIVVSPRISGTSIPLKIYSYLQAGKAIIATDIPAHRYVLNPEVAELVEPSKEGIAEGLIKLMGDDTLRKKLGNKSRTLAAEKYNQKQYLVKLEKIYSGFQTQGIENRQEAGVTKVD